MEMKIDCRDGVLYIMLCGEVDEHGVTALRKETDRKIENIARKIEKVVFDLTKISFMDSTGIGFLIGRYKKFSRYGITAYIKNPTPATDRILSMSGIYTLMPKI